MKTRIITDSTCDLTADIKKLVDTVPLTVHFGDKKYIDGIDISRETFYKKLAESKILPTTSQAAPTVFEEEFEKVKEAGDEAVVITISSKLSGTYQSAVIAAENYKNIYVVDSATVAIGAGILTELALKLAAEGKRAAEIAAQLNAEKEKIIIIAMVDTLEYLKRGGRISKTAAFAGTMLNIKPVLCVENGEITVLGKARGSKQCNNLLAEEIKKCGGVDFSKPVLLGYTGTSNALLLQYINDSQALWQNGLKEVRYACIGSVVGTHAGPGAVAAAFYKK